jgi:hypothetical protein
MLNFTTLFDINFVTQGIAMYESLKRHCDDFHLYMFAFCDESYDILTKLNLEKVTVISLKEFEDEELLKVKPTRTKAEYCWTCSSSTIKYCLEKFNLDHCTYIDADLYFYSNPKVLVDEMGDKSVLITEHRYTPDYDRTRTSGKYCVQFMTFKNDEKGLKVLNWWRDACLDWCYARIENGKFGDQKYLDDWTERFEGIHVLEHLGGGVAPWNIHQYDISKKGRKFNLIETKTQKKAEFVFYHFHCVKILSSGAIDETKYNIYYIGDDKQELIYTPYVKNLVKISKKLHKIDNRIPIVKKVVSKVLERKLREFIKWILTIRFSKRKRVLRVFGHYIIKSADLDD